VEKEHNLTCGYAGTRVHLTCPATRRGQNDVSIRTGDLGRAITTAAIDHDNLTFPGLSHPAQGPGDIRGFIERWYHD
jgi:hypothetical protein